MFKAIFVVSTAEKLDFINKYEKFMSHPVQIDY